MVVTWTSDGMMVVVVEIVVVVITVLVKGGAVTVAVVLAVLTVLYVMKASMSTSHVTVMGYEAAVVRAGAVVVTVALRASMSKRLARPRFLAGNPTPDATGTNP
jgi:hypothetical protein